jgi:hypothetical protein
MALAWFVEECAAFSNGPPDGVAGNPPSSQTCWVCHGDFPLNSGDGQLQLLGVPGMIVPGQTYGLMLELEDPGQTRWGFELTVVNAENEASGTIVVTDPDSTQLSDNPDPDPDYLKHTSIGTGPGTAGPRKWSFEWIAGNDMQVDFYVAANAADNSGNIFGDFIYAIQESAGGVTSVATAGPASSRALIGLRQNHPNPFNPTTSISFSLNGVTDVTLRILDVTGAVVRSLLDGRQVAGEHSVAWDGTNDAGMSVSSGVYFYRLEGNGVTETRKMTLLK